MLKIMKKLNYRKLYCVHIHGVKLFEAYIINQIEHDVDLLVLQNHLATCSYKMVSCVNKNCDITMQRKNFTLHMTTTCHSM